MGITRPPGDSLRAWIHRLILGVRLHISGFQGSSRTRAAWDLPGKVEMGTCWYLPLHGMMQCSAVGVILHDMHS